MSLLENHNCAYTTSSGENWNFSVHALIEILSGLPEVPKLMTMKIGVVKSEWLPENWIMLSPNIAEALEKALAKHDTVKI